MKKQLPTRKARGQRGRRGRGRGRQMGAPQETPCGPTRGFASLNRKAAGPSSPKRELDVRELNGRCCAKTTTNNTLVKI